MAIFTINVRPRVKLGVAGRSRESFITGEVKEYAEVRVTSLKSDTAGGSILAVVYNWFKGLFPALVDGSVKSYIIGLLTVVKDLATRVGLLEDKYILKYVVPVDTAAIDLTTDKYGNAFNFVECDELFLSFNIPQWNLATLGRINMRINNISSPIYNVQNVTPFSSIFTAGTNYKNQRCLVRLIIINNEILGFYTNQSTSLNDSRISEFHPFYTVGFNSGGITSIQLITQGGVTIPANSVFILKKK